MSYDSRERTGMEGKTGDVHQLRRNDRGREEESCRGNDEEDLMRYVPLYKAALLGDWEKATEFLHCNPNAMTATITSSGRNLLQVAIAGGHTSFLEKLVLNMPKDALEVREYTTALGLAASTGNVEIAEILISKNANLTQMKDDEGWTPLCHALAFGHDKMVSYLLSVTGDESPSPFRSQSGAQLLNSAIRAGLYDVALHLVQNYPEVATTKDPKGILPLELLVTKPSAFWSGVQMKFWQRCIYSCIPVDVDQVKAQPYRCERRDTEDPHECSGQHPCMPVRFFNRVFPGLNQLFWSIKKHLSHRIKLIHDKKLMHSQVLKLVRCILKQMEEMKSSEIIQHFEKNTILNEAVKNGIVEIVVESLKCFPNLIGGVTDGKTIFHIAVEFRREKVFNLIYKLSLYDNILFLSDGNRNTILHFAGKLAPYDRLNSVSGAALQMQRELQWLEELENLLEPMWKERTNKDDKTARALFTEEHKDLVAEAGTWMKDTSTSCMVVATLIVTVLFAAAFTVPGGNNNDNGKPVFLGTSLFTIFLIADMIGLFSSSTSVLMFLSILTSRYAEEDFLYSLPKKLIIGLATLFISIAALIISFTLTLFIILQSKQSFLIIPIALMACLPIYSFTVLQFPLLIEMVRSTYGNAIFNLQEASNLLT